MLYMGHATLSFFAGLFAIVLADEPSWHDGLFELSKGYQMSLWALGLEDSYSEFESELDVYSSQRFFVEKGGRNLSEHFPDSAHLDYLEPCPFSSQPMITLKLANVSLTGLSKPLVHRISKIKHHNDGTPKIASYLFGVTYHTLVLNASYHYLYHTWKIDPSQNVQCSGQLSVKIVNTTVEGTIRVHEDDNEKVRKIVTIDLAPRTPSGYQMRITKCDNTSTDAMLLLWNSEKYSTGERLKDKLLPVVTAKILRHLNSLISSPDSAVN